MPLNAREQAVKAYTRLVLSIGRGFHPDTRGVDYVSLPAGYTAEDYERIVLTAVEEGVDIYDVAAFTLDLGHYNHDTGRFQ